VYKRASELVNYRRRLEAEMFKLPELQLLMVACLLFSSLAGVGFVYHDDHAGFLSDHIPQLFTMLRNRYLDTIPSGDYASILRVLNLNIIEKAHDGVTQYMCGWHSSAYDEAYSREIL
jgi:hypothetical protein